MSKKDALEAESIFNAVWRELEVETGQKNLRFPKKLILLGGAPGSGKGTNTAYLCKVLGITSKPIVMSSLLETPEMKAIKNSGGMVGDREVIDILFREMLDPAYRQGAVLDGFPRTRAQAECIKMLYEKMLALTDEFQELEVPAFSVVILFVEEKESIIRQTKRGRETLAHNEEVKRIGKGKLLELRPTDIDEDYARKRYLTFMEQTHEALHSLKDVFEFHLIDAQPPIKEVQKNISKALKL